MTIHSNLTSLIKESILEFLQAAELSLSYRKPDGGCLGYPGVALMFSIADSIGSYHRGDSNFSVSIDGKNVSIKKDDFHHFYIFNSNYYKLSLSESEIKKLYNNYRCLLLHNSAIPINHALFASSPNDPPFLMDERGIHVNVFGFLAVTRNAVQEFMKVIDKVVPRSAQYKNMELKR